jgi:hypothetical protein
MDDPSLSAPAEAAAVIDTSASSLVSTSAERTPKFPNKTCCGRKRRLVPPEAAHMTSEEIDQWHKEQLRERNRAQAKDAKQREKDYLEYLEQQRVYYWRAYREVQRQLSEALPTHTAVAPEQEVEKIVRWHVMEVSLKCRERNGSVIKG